MIQRDGDSQLFEAVLRAATEYSIIATDTTGTITVFNEGAERMLGYRAADVIGRLKPLAIHDAAEVAVRAAELGLQPGFEVLVVAARRGAAETRQWTYVRADGSRLPVSLTVTAMHDRQGNTTGFIGIARDVTEYQRAQRDRAQLLLAEQKAREEAEAVARMNRRVQVVTDAALAHLALGALLEELLDRIGEILTADTVVFLLIDSDGYLVTRAARGLGGDEDLTTRIPIGQGLTGRVAAERRPIVVNGIDESRVLPLYPRRKGTISLVGVPLLVEGRVIGVLHVGTSRRHEFGDDDVRLLQLVADRAALAIDRARLYEAEREARAAAERLAAERVAILGQIADGVIIVSPDGEIAFANAAARGLLGLSPSDGSAVDRRADGNRSLNGPSLPMTALPLVHAALDGHTTIGEELRIEWDHTSARVVEASAAPVVAPDGDRLGAVLTLRDVSAQRDLERQKDEFIANVSHELKTPLTGIKASIGVILANEPPSTPEPLHRMLVNIGRASDRLEKLVADLLELSRLQAGRVQLRPRPSDLNALAGRAARAIEPLAQERGQRVILDLPDAPLFGVVDAERLEQAVLNLLSNAHKYGLPGGQIGLRVERAGDEVRIAISDNGPGVPVSEQKRIFERFYRSDSEATRRNSGSGLGLPIARAMVELHGGRIWVESAPGEGATFWIALPIDGPAAKPGEGDTP